MNRLLDNALGVYTPEAWASIGALLFAQARRRRSAFSVIVVSVDTPEAPGEEDALRAVAGALLGTIRSGDLVGRHGEFSFVVLAPDAREAGAARLVERLSASLFDCVATETDPLAPRLLLGRATLPEDGQTLEQLVRRAGVLRKQLTTLRTPEAEPPGPAQDEAIAAAAEPWERLRAQRQAALELLSGACARGQIEGIALQTQSGACVACVDAARDIYRPDYRPQLPLAGCGSSGGCRCTYTSPALTPRWLLELVGEAAYGQLDVPRRLRDAGRCGVDPRVDCLPAQLIEYLEGFPLVCAESQLALQQGEQALLLRPAQIAWERPQESHDAPGRPLPLVLPLTTVDPERRRLPSYAAVAPLPWQPGSLYVSDRRLVFEGSGPERVTDALGLLDLVEVECYRELVACRVRDWQSRLLLLVRDPLPVALILARILRQAILAR